MVLLLEIRDNNKFFYCQVIRDHDDIAKDVFEDDQGLHVLDCLSCFDAVDKIIQALICLQRYRLENYTRIAYQEPYSSFVHGLEDFLMWCIRYHDCKISIR